MKKYIFIILVVIWMSVIFIMSNSPGDESQETSSAVGKMFCRIFVSDYEEMSVDEQEELALSLDHPIRKMAHFTEYLILGALLVGVPQYKIISEYWKKSWILWGIAGLYAVTDEVHQWFVPGRNASVADVVLDSAGAMVGVCIGVLIVWIFMKLQRKRIASVEMSE